ncbi:MAG: SDR family NAD(P)-dependent oxidoreductase, partial [Bacteroidetes bacterium]|nr:SDR family NAD(P)-dependent oxidoreductase [Bacteroidota bacterium]
MKRILVTGGAGFIGSHLVKYLVEKGDEVIVADILLRGNKIDKEIQKSVKFVNADVRNYEKMAELSKNCDMIFHFAAILGVDVVADNPVETMETEVIGMKNITEAAMKNGVQKVIYASTSGVYGHSALEKSVTENIQLDPRTSYAIAKRYNEIYLTALYEEKGLQSISLRFFNVYGVNQDNRMVIPRFFEQAIKNDPITVYGKGFQTRDFTYIDDTIYASIQLAEKINGCEIFNIANEHEFSISELAQTIHEITNSKSKISLIQAPKKRYDFEVGRRVGNSQKLYKSIKYKPSTKLKDGLMKIYMRIEHRA